MKPRIEIAILFSSFLLLLVMPVYGEGSYTTTQTYVIIAEAKVEVRDLVLSQYSVYPGSSIDFSVKLRNFGTASTTATAEVKIYDAADIVVGTISYDPVDLSPSQMVTIQKTWSVGSLPLGTYRAVAQATYESNTSNSVEKTFSIIALPTQPPAPPNQPMGNLVPTILPSIITPLAGKAIFLRTTVLKEILAGEGGIESISLKNIGENILNISLSVAGVPPGWVALNSDKTLLLPNETRLINLALSIPQDVLSGDYLVKLNAEGGGNSTDFLALRVKGYPEGYDQPIALKTIRINEKESKTMVSIYLTNPSQNNMAVVQLQERIPLSVSDEQVEFLDKQGKISEVNGAKVITWEFSNIHPKETFYISYNIKDFLTDYSTYMNWHVSQILVTEKQSTAELVKILDLSSSAIDENGEGQVTASVLYVGNDPMQVTILLEAPSDFTVEPATLTKVLIPKAVTSVSFKLSYPKATSNTHMVRLVVLGSDFSTYMTAPVLSKGEVPRQSFSLLPIFSLDQIVILSASVAALVAISVRSYQTIKSRPKVIYDPERLEYMKNVKNMVTGKYRK